MPFNHGYELTWETVAHALTKGLQLRTRGRLVEPSALTKAQNVEYPVTGGVQKRRGHVSTRIAVNAPTPAVTDPATNLTGVSIEPFEQKVLPADWLPGYGRFDATSKLTDGDLFGYAPSRSKFETTPLSLGGFNLLGSPVTWTGDQFVSATGLATDPVLLPVARAQSFAAESSAAQYTQATRMADGSLVIAAPVAQTGTGSLDIKVSVYNSQNSLVLFRTFTYLAAITCVRAVPFEGGAYVYITGATGGLARSRITPTSIGDLALVGVGAPQTFDVCVSPDPTDSYMVLAYQNTTQLRVEKWTQATSAVTTTATTAPGWDYAWSIACDVHPVTKRVVVAWLSDGLGGLTRTQRCVQLFTPGTFAAEKYHVGPWQIYSIFNQLQDQPEDFTNSVWDATGAPSSVAAFANEFAKLSVGFRYLQGSGYNLEVFDVWASTAVKGIKTTAGSGYTDRITCLTTHTCYSNNPFGAGNPLTVNATTYLPFFEVAGRAMVVGSGPVVPLQYHGFYGNTLWSRGGLRTSWGVSAQPTLLLLNTADKPVGKLNGLTSYGSYHGFYARWPGNYVYSGVAPRATVGIVSVQEQLQTSQGKTPYQAPVADVIDLDFLHPLSVTVQGKSAFIAGAQVWEYDGRRLTEAGFHLAPEVDMVSDTGTALATPLTYRVELFDVSEKGEQTRSASIPYKTKTEVLAGQTDLSTIWVGPSWRRGSAVLTFQSLNSAVYLESSRDPTKSPAFGATFAAHAYGMPATYRPGAVSGDEEIHPSSTIGYLQPNSFPACELIATGNNRLWLAGGQVPIGSVTTSMLYQPGFAAGWNDYNTQHIEGLADPVVDFAFLQDSAFVFKTNNVYLVNSDGPDNFGQGPQWPPPRQLSVGGTPFRNSAVSTPEGVMFVSNAGAKLINYAGGMSPIGDADPELFKGKIVAAVNFASKDQVRWYKSNGDAVVFDYREGRFSTWTGLECRTAFVANERAYLVRLGGYLWREAYGTEEVWQDDTTSIEMLIRTAWNPMGTGEIGYGRCRRIAWTGEFRGDHNVRMRTFYNESAVHEDEYVLNWATQGALATSWGSDFWGFGAWGGASEDKIWRWAWRPSRNKCSVIMFELSDLGANSAGFVPVCYGFEIGRRGGLDRVRMK